jgi:hypothetical protein
MTWPTLTNQAVVISARIETRPGDWVSHGWQEVRILHFHEHLRGKTLRHRVRAEVVIGYDATGHGEASVWASSSWKPIIKLRLDDLPPVASQGPEPDRYAAAIDKLFRIAANVVGG